MKHIILALKGVLFGLSNAIAGVSGGTIAVITGIYDKLIYSINHLFSDTKVALKFLIVFIIGALIGFLGGSKVINICLEYAAIPTSCLFAGFVLGGIPGFGKPLVKNINVKNIIFTIIGILLVVGLLFAPDNSWKTASDLEIYDYILLFVAGFFGAVSMITPGISGMMIFMLIGYYKVFNSAIANILDFSQFTTNLFILLPIALGIIVGIFSASKLIAYLFDKFPTQSNFVVIGFIVASVFCILYKTEWEANTLMIILGILALIVGAALTFTMDYFGNKKQISDINE